MGYLNKEEIFMRKIIDIMMIIILICFVSYVVTYAAVMENVNKVEQNYRKFTAVFGMTVQFKSDTIEVRTFVGEPR